MEKRSSWVWQSRLHTAKSLKYYSQFWVPRCCAGLRIVLTLRRFGHHGVGKGGKGGSLGPDIRYRRVGKGGN